MRFPRPSLGAVPVPGEYVDTTPPEVAAAERDMAQREEEAQRNEVFNEAVRSGLQNDINKLNYKKRTLMGFAERLRKSAPDSPAFKNYLDEASNLDRQIAVKKAALGNPKPETAADPTPIDVQEESQPTEAVSPAVQEAVVPDVQARQSSAVPPPSNMPTMEQLQAPAKEPLRWKFGGADGPWNEFNPETGTSQLEGGGDPLRAAMPDILSPGVGGGRPDPSMPNDVVADVTRGGGGFYMPSESDVAYLPDSVVEEAAKRNELQALRRQSEALGEIPATINLPESIDPNQTPISTQDFIERVLPALLNYQILGQRYPSMDTRADALAGRNAQYDDRIKSLAKEAADLAAQAGSEEEANRIAEQYGQEIERLKQEQAQIANLLGVNKDIVGGGAF